MNHTNQINAFKKNTDNMISKAIEAVVEQQNAEFQKLITSFLGNLNSRYKRHCFIFSDNSGCMTISLYSRVTKEELCYWDGQGEINYQTKTQIAMQSSFRTIAETDLNDEIASFMNAIDIYACPVKTEYFFQWDGKSSFDFVEDATN